MAKKEKKKEIALYEAGEIEEFQRVLETEAKKFELIQRNILSQLVEGEDYGYIEGRRKDGRPWKSQKPVLFKGGAEKILAYMRLRAEYKRDDETWEMLGKLAGTVCYICEIYNREGNKVGEGRGVATLEEFGNMNTTVKMAEKRAKIDAVLNTLGLSTRFTQDEEIIEESMTIEKPPPENEDITSLYDKANALLTSLQDYIDEDKYIAMKNHMLQALNHKDISKMKEIINRIEKKIEEVIEKNGEEEIKEEEPSPKETETEEEAVTYTPKQKEFLEKLLKTHVLSDLEKVGYRKSFEIQPSETLDELQKVIKERKEYEKEMVEGEKIEIPGEILSAIFLLPQAQRELVKSYKKLIVGMIKEERIEDALNEIEKIKMVKGGKDVS